MYCKKNFPLIGLLVIATSGAIGWAEVVQGEPEPEIRQLLGVTDSYPDWSPDGESVVFETDRTGTNEVFRYDLNDGELVQLTHSGGSERYPVFSPEGEWIAFQSLRDGYPALYVMRRDGSDLSRVTGPPDDGSTDLNRSLYDSHPKWSPDGRSIVFNRTVTEPDQEVFEIDVDGTGLRKLTDYADRDTYPSISPDGRYLLWRRVLPEGGDTRSGRNSEIFIADREGGNPRNISNHSAFEGYPTWLPGSDGVVFASNRNGESPYDLNIYVMRPDGSRVTKLTETVPGVLQVKPSVSPDGQSILFNRVFHHDEDYETTWIYTMQFDRPVADLLESK